MKRVLIALFLCLIFSASAHAKKPEIFYSKAGVLALNQHAETKSCIYTCTAEFSATVHAHKSSALTFNLLLDNETVNLFTRPFEKTTDYSGRSCPRIVVDAGTNWALVWALESDKGNGRIIDAVEQLSGTCPQ